MKANARILFLTFIFTVGCKDHFNPDLSFKDTHFLVVEGYINAGTDAVTVIRLSRTVSLKEPNAEPPMEQGASVSIEDDNGNSYSLTETKAGIYVSDTLILPLDRQYRIHISSNEKEYISAFTVPIQTPEIDSVSWKWEGDQGVNIRVATHDPNKKTLFYQWDYEEIWELRSAYRSAYDYKNGSFILREEEEIQQMRICWRRSTPSDLLMESTAKFDEDAISMKVVNIPVFSPKLGENYSLLVTQHALSVDAFGYLQIMAKNTNSLGTFYDPQPSQLIGNIEVPGSEEPVIGYIGAYTTSQQRIYIRNSELPNWGFDRYCEEIFTSLDEPEMIAIIFGTNGLTPTIINEFNAMGATRPDCADCRLRGGDNNQPPFWEEVFW